MLACIIACSNALAQTTNIFNDNFPGTIMSSAKWYIPTYVSDTDGTYTGRTQFRCTPAALPSVISGEANINLDTYNLTAPPGDSSFYGTDVITNKKFSPGAYGLIFTICAKIKNPGCGGIVAGIFLYNKPEPYSGDPHDEVDFELLTNRLTAIQTNIYDSIPLGAGSPESWAITDSITDVHTYVIEWLPTEVLWYLDGALIRDTNLSITDTMHLHLNMYAPASAWTLAYNGCVMPTASPARDTTYTMLVCSVRVDSLLAPLSVPNAIKQNPATTFYPNPANGIIRFTKPVKNVVIYDIAGKALINAPEITGNCLQITGLPAGLYIIEYRDNNNIARYGKLVINDSP